MYRKCVTEVSVQHQRQIEDALLELMQKVPFEDISVTQVCDLAGVSRRVFYHLFNNKTGALYALIDHTVLGIEGYRTDLKRQALRFFLYWREQKRLLDALQNNKLSGILLERMIDSVLREDYDILYWLKSMAWKDEKSIVIFLLTGTMGLVYTWYYSGFEKSPEEMSALLVRIMSDPLIK